MNGICLNIFVTMLLIILFFGVIVISVFFINVSIDMIKEIKEKLNRNKSNE